MHPVSYRPGERSPSARRAIFARLRKRYRQRISLNRGAIRRHRVSRSHKLATYAAVFVVHSRIPCDVHKPRTNTATYRIAARLDALSRPPPMGAHAGQRVATMHTAGNMHSRARRADTLRP